MNLAEKVPNLSNICGIAIDLSAVPIPSYSGNSQGFYDSYLSASAAQSVYYGKRTVKFFEKSKKEKAGTWFECGAEIQFPNSDGSRSKRIEEFLKAKYLVISLSNGKSILLGRNDYFQNAAPSIEVESNEQLTKVSFSSKSMFAPGFLPGYNAGLLPHSVPVNLLNAN